jgi:hypothetical protein
VTAGTIRFLGESVLLQTASRIVEFFGDLRLGARVRINIDITEFLAAFPAPGTATARAYHEQIGIGLESAGEYIVTGGVLQTPAFAPGALFGIGHLCYYGMTLKNP